MRTKVMRLTAAFVTVVALAVGGSAIASAQNNAAPKKPAAAKQHRAVRANAASRAHRSNAAIRKASANPGESAESSGESSSAADNDGSAQAAACQKAGVSGDNVNYDDQTGTCTADAGGNSGANN